MTDLNLFSLKFRLNPTIHCHISKRSGSYQARIQGRFLPPNHKILQFARVFKKKPENSHL